MARTGFEDDPRDDEVSARSRRSGNGLLISLLVAGGLLVFLVCGGGLAALFVARTAVRHEQAAAVARAESQAAEARVQEAQAEAAVAVREVGPAPREVDLDRPAGHPGALAVDAGELCWAFQADRVAAERRYQRKVVELTAAVAVWPGRNPAARPFAVLTAGGLYRIAVYFLDSQADRVAALTKGETVRVRGTLARAVIDRADATVTVTLEDCSLLDTRQADPAKEPDDRPVAKEADPKRPEAKTPERMPPEDRTHIRQEIYLRIIRAIDDVETAAVMKFGRRPKADDLATVTLPYKLFIERETEKALDALAADRGMPRSVLNGIKSEGDRKTWPKRETSRSPGR